LNSRFGYIRNDTFLHGLNPSQKLFSLILVVTGIMVYPSWIISGLVILFILFGFVSAGIKLQLSMARVRFLILFSIALLVLQVLLTPNGTVLGHFIPQIGDAGPFFPITDFGLDRGLGISLRFLLIVFASMLFISVTNPTLLSHSLTRIGIPYRYSYSLIIALRFLPLLDYETNSVRMAQKSRGITPQIGGLKKTLRTIRYTFFPLLVSALSRVESLSLSMEGRGFGYRKERTYLRSSKWNFTDYLVMILSIGFLLFCISLSLGVFPFISSLP
jgi:energy-coupling factor transport system permease protein